MSRVALSFLAVALFFPTQANALQSYTGTWTMQGTNGPVTIVLNAPGRDGAVTGTVSGSGVNFRIQSEVQADRLLGYALTADGNAGVYFEAMHEGAALRVLFADIDAAGEPVASTAQQFVFQRATASATGGSANRSAPRQPGAPAAGGAAGRPVAGTGPQDRQIADLLLSGPWCSFSYTGSTTRRERHVFRQDGVVVSASGAETSRSVRGTDQYGNETFTGGSGSRQSGGTQTFWRVENGVLLLSQDGAQWAPQQLQITRNSSGWPIITASGTEYARCD